MITTIYIIIFSYFVLGATGFYFINRKKDAQTARKSWTKFASYFIIIHILFFSIVIDSFAFRVLSILIITVGLFELFSLFKKSGYHSRTFFSISLIIYAISAYGFFVFSGLDKYLILFSFLILSIFDSFSQISGQLWGKTKIAPVTSPNKTLGGTVGGSIVAIFSALLLNDLYEKHWYVVMILATGVVIFAFAGDMAASFYKRKFEVKDYSNVIPGHGGFLDRFDSLIAGGAWVALFVSAISYFQ